MRTSIFKPKDVAAEPKQEGEALETGVVKVAELLQRGTRRALSDQDLAARSVGMSRRNLMRYMAAVAESSVRNQQLLLDKVLDYVTSMETIWDPSLFLHHIKYDETPIRCTASYEIGAPAAELIKAFMVESSWLILLRRKEPTPNLPRYTCLRGSFSPECRFAENATAQSIAKLLQTCWTPPPAVQQFRFKWRLAETDAAPANLKCERIVTNNQAGWSALHGHCSAHRAHSIATKAFDLPMATGPVITGCTRSLLVMASAGGLRRFIDVLLLEVEENLTIQAVDTLSADAVAFRRNVLALFSPPAQRTHAFQTVKHVAEKVMNGDWRSGKIVHVCHGCCGNLRDTVALIRAALPKLVRALWLRVLNKANWLSWDEALNLVGLLSHMHGLYKRTFQRAFTNHWQEPIPLRGIDQPQEADREQIAVWRQELTRNLRAAQSFWELPDAEWRIYLLVQSLQPQRVFMHSLFTKASKAWEQQQLHNLEIGGPWLSGGGVGVPGRGDGSITQQQSFVSSDEKSRKNPS